MSNVDGASRVGLRICPGFAFNDVADPDPEDIKSHPLGSRTEHYYRCRRCGISRALHQHGYMPCSRAMPRVPRKTFLTSTLGRARAAKFLAREKAKIQSKTGARAPAATATEEVKRRRKAYRDEYYKRPAVVARKKAQAKRRQKSRPSC